MAQKLLLTWLVNYPQIFNETKKYVSPEDFVTPLYRQVAGLLYAQHEEGDVNPGRLLNHFQDSEEQKEVAGLFNAVIPLESEEEQNRAYADTILKIKNESLAKKNKEWDPADIQGMTQLIFEQKKLEDLTRRKNEIRAPF